jgi:hypothetical protein
VVTFMIVYESCSFLWTKFSDFRVILDSFLFGSLFLTTDQISVISCCGFTFATIFVLPVSLGSRPVMFRPSSEEAESSSRLCFNRRRPESLPGFDSNRAPHRVESIARLWGLRFPLPICSRSPLKRIGKIFFCFLLLGSHSREQLVLAPSLILEAAACAL